MNIISVQPKEIHVTFELSIQEIEWILEYYDLANMLYAKVHKDATIEAGEYMENDFISKLRLIFDDVKKGIGNGT